MGPVRLQEYSKLRKVQDRQLAFKVAFIKSHDVTKAIEDSSVTQDEVDSWCCDKAFVESLEHLDSLYANSVLLTPDFVKAVLFSNMRPLLASESLSREQVRLVEIASRMFNMDQANQKDTLSQADDFVIISKAKAVKKALPAVELNGPNGEFRDTSGEFKDTSGAWSRM